MNIYNNQYMEKNKECSDLLDSIIKELTITKKQSTEIASRLHDQTIKLENTDDNLNSINYDNDVSKWHLNHIKATFGKVYKKFNNFPIKEKTELILDSLKINTKIDYHNIKKISLQNDSNTEDNNCKLNLISNMISDINYITNLNSDEIDKHNKLLDKNIEKTEIVENKMVNNIQNIKKIIR